MATFGGPASNYPAALQAGSACDPNHFLQLPAHHAPHTASHHDLVALLLVVMLRFQVVSLSWVFPMGLPKLPLQEELSTAAFLLLLYLSEKLCLNVLRVPGLLGTCVRVHARAR
jgi:hypothetical protein